MQVYALNQRFMGSKPKSMPRVIPNRGGCCHALLTAFLLFPFSVRSATTVNWPQFRGPNASGISEDPAPITWNLKSGDNILWQTPIPGLGHACPIIWENHIYIATAVKPDGRSDLKVGLYGDIDSYKETTPHQWRLLCLDKSRGQIVWDKLVLEAVPRSQRHTKASHCNSTPATDGKRLVALFGSEGMFCFDMEGKQLWRKDLGPLDTGFYVMTNTQWGFATSPILYEDKVILQCDIYREQFVAAFDARDGHELWRTPRNDVPTWCTPVVAVSPGRTQVILNGLKEIGGYDLGTGRRLWNLKDGGDIPVASPIVAEQMAILTSAHGKARPIRAVRLDAAGDVSTTELGETNKSVVWCHPRQGSYLQTPIAVGDFVFSSLDGILSCFELKTGKVNFSERIGNGAEGFTSSPVAAHGKLYFTGEQGDVYVLNATNHFSVLATNKLGGICLTTPAISEGNLYFRTVDNLVAIGFKR